MRGILQLVSAVCLAGVVSAALPGRLAAGQPIFVAHGPIFNQGADPSCVGYAFSAYLQGTIDGTWLYRQAKAVDGSTDYTTGTWVSSAGEVLLEDHRIQRLRESGRVDDGLARLYQGAGFLVDSAWTSDMRDPVRGVVTPTGTLVGYHAYYCYGYAPTTRQVWCQNSWGESWGDRGTFRIDAGALQRIVRSIFLPTVDEYRPFPWVLYQ